MPIDIDQSYYATGTATVAAGGTVVTGQGTQWQGAVRAGDLFGSHVGMPVRIASVDSNTQLTLAYPWAGAAQDAAAYEIQFTPYKSGYQEAVRQLLLTLASGNLEAIAGLAAATDKLPYFTGEGQAALATFPASARALLALVAAADKLPYFTGDGTADLAAFPASARSLAGLVAAADKLPYFTGANTAGLTALTAFARTLLDDADATTMLSTLGAQAKLGYTPANKAGDNFTGPVNFTGSATANAFSALDRITSAAPGTDGYGPFWAIGGFSTGYRAEIYFHIKNGQYSECVIRSGDINGSPAYFTMRSNGDMNAPGALTAATKNFLIDHPVDPFDRDLYHAAIEGPRYDLLYRGSVDLVAGAATVDIDAANRLTAGTFAALTQQAIVATLQNQTGFARLRPGPIDGGSFEIACEDASSTDTVTWIVLAERADPYIRQLAGNVDEDGRLVPEQDKEAV